MCGIAGTTHKQAVIHTNLMAHRGPDGFGQYRDEYIALHHRRLAIIDLDERSNQPMWDEKHEVCIIYNGEIYNFSELKSDLSQKYTFKTSSDTEVVLYGYKEYGNKIWARLSGMFAVCIYDKRSGEIILARDHCGIKPLYYHVDKQHISFASELSVLAKIAKSTNDDLQIDSENASLYFAFGYFPSPLTPYKNVFQVQKSSFVIFDLKLRTLAQHFYKAQAIGAENITELQSLVEESILQHLISDVPVGLFFSGGTDSSLIASVLKKYDKPLKTFSLKVSGRDIDSYYFEAISKKLGLRNEVVDFGQKEFDFAYEEVRTKIDLPIADNSIFPTYYISKIASQSVKVVLSGEGGDELFFGYPRQKALFGLSTSLRSLGKILAFFYQNSPHFPGKGIFYQNMLKQLQESILLYIATVSPYGDNASYDAVINAAKCIFQQATQPEYFDRDFYLENILLRKLDMSTMFNSIEGRVPLLSPALFASSPLFANQFEKRGDLKIVLKKILNTYLPDDLVFRKKSGFGLNQNLFIPKSQILKADLEESIEFMREQGIGLNRSLTAEHILLRKPTLAIPTVLFYRSLINVLKTQ